MSCRPVKGASNQFSPTAWASAQKESTWAGPPFRGAKVALLCDGMLLTYLRDDKPDIPFPGRWDLPGGGRENEEGPVACVLRETEEEFGLTIPADRIVWGRFYPKQDPSQPGSFFLADTITMGEIAAIRFGEEGQSWAMTDLHEFLTHPLSVSNLTERLADFLGEDSQ